MTLSRLAEAFAKQAASDLDAYDFLCASTLPRNARRLDNVEYPWRRADGEAVAPTTWPFPLAERLHTPTGRLLIKAATALTRNPAVFLAE